MAIDEKPDGSDGPEVAKDLNDRALTLRHANRLADAEPLLRQALAINEKSWGPDHPYVAINLGNLASLLRATNRPAEAEPLFRRALAIREKSLGPDDPRVAASLDNLASFAAGHRPARRGRAALSASPRDQRRVLRP